MSNTVPDFPKRDDIIARLTETFGLLKANLSVEGVNVAEIVTKLAAVEALLAEPSKESLLKASKDLRDLEVALKAIENEAKRLKAEAEVAKSRREARLQEAKTAMTAAMDAISQLWPYKPSELAQVTKFAKLDLLKKEGDTARALREELRLLIKHYEDAEAGQTSSEFTLALKDIEERAKAAKVKMDTTKAGSTSTIVGWIIVGLSIAIVLAIAFWGKPGEKDAFLEKVPWSVLVATSFGVLFMIIGTMAEKMNEFDVKRVPDYFHRFAQAWVYTILLTLVLPVTYMVTVEEKGTQLPLDDILVGFFVGMFVYQVEKALKEVGVRLLPIEKFLERKQLISPGAWQERLRSRRDTLHSELETAVETKSFAEQTLLDLNERFSEVDAQIAAGDEAVAQAALDKLAMDVKLAIASAEDRQ